MMEFFTLAGGRSVGRTPVRGQKKAAPRAAFRKADTEPVDEHDFTRF
jgi:hypothetical protein